MKHYSFIFALAISEVFTSYSVFAQQHINSFDSKKRRSIIVSDSLLPQQVIRGNKQPIAVQNNSIRLAIAGANQKSFRTASKDQVIIAGQTGLPIFISGYGNPAARTAAGDIKSACYAYLSGLKNTLKVSDPEKQFGIRSILSDIDGSSHLRLSQQYKGITIYGAEVIVHLNASGSGEAFNGNYHLIREEVDTIPSITWKKALETVITDISSKTKYRMLSEGEKKLLGYDAPKIDTVIFQHDTKRYILAYHISLIPNLLERWEYFVDASSASILEAYKSTCHADGGRTASATDLNGVTRTINTYQQGGSYFFEDASKSMFVPATQEGIIFTLDANFTFSSNFKVQDIASVNNVWNNPKAVSAHYNSGVAFDYYKNTHKRNSIDGKGGSIISVINVVDEEGGALDNAYWNGKAMFYGNGNTEFKPLAGGMDVGGHEMTHGVVQNTANLVYQGESGAINESMADIFGCMMDPEDWTIGEDVVNKSIFPTGALRSLMDPHNGGNSLNDPGYQPKHMNEKYNGSQDNNGVHINSGIPNYAYYLFATAIGKAKAEQVYYRTLSVYLTQNAQFIDLRLAVIKSAKDLYGDASNEASQAGIAFDAVGITEKTGGTYTTTLPVNPGQEYMLVYNTDDNDANGLYRVAGQDFKPLTQKSTLLNKPSITDNGNYAVYVGTDNKIYGIDVNPTDAAVPVVIQEQPIWYNVAVSKDGNKVAAVTLDPDTSIYVFDLQANTSVRFMLYNPTFSTGVKSGGPMYADSFEWDYSGENIVYDAFNSISNTDGSKIEYWDINFISVWDNASGKFADGNIFKLISNLDAGENIGNPTFSKNSPNILAFDYFNVNDTTNYIIGYDIEHNNLGAIAANNTIGYPSFNKNDNEVALTTLDDLGNTEVGIVSLNSDKISSAGNISITITGAEWPVYYSVGTRNTSVGTTDKEVITTDIRIFPNPVTHELSVQLPQPSSGNTTLEIFNQLGELVLSKPVSTMGGGQASIDVSMLSQGMYTLSLRNEDDVRRLRFIKE